MAEAGDGEPADRTRAEGRFAEACEKGGGAGCANLARLRGGLPGQRALYERACALGTGSVCADLGMALVSGKKLPRDPERALALFVRGCEVSEPVACRNAGIQFFKGVGAPRDKDRSLALFVRACQLGDQPACKELE